MSTTALPEGWIALFGAHGVERAVLPGACEICGRDHQDWPHEPSDAAAAPVTVTAELAELRRLAGEWSR